jgi:hypothetical protein
MLKIAVFAPIPNARVRMIMRVKPGLFRMMRKVYRTSLNNIFIIFPIIQFSDWSLRADLRFGVYSFTNASIRARVFRHLA